MMRNHLSYVALILTLLQIIITSNGAADEGAVTKGKTRADLTPNRMADILLRRLQKNLEERQVESLTVAGVGPLGKGTFVGLASIKRNGDTLLLHQNRSIGVKATLDAERTRVTFPCSLSVFGKNMCDGGATLSFRGLPVYLEVKVRDTEDGKPQLDLCDVSDLGNVSLSFADQEGPIGSIFSWATSWMSTLLRSRVSTNMQDVLCDAVASNLT